METNDFQISLFLSDEQAKTYKQKEEYILLAAKQIIKDFSEANIEIQFSGEASTAYDELSEQVNAHVSRLFDENVPLLLHLLYRIDLSEKRINETRRKFPSLSESEIITDLIIMREMAKVVFRTLYSQKNKETNRNLLE